MSPLKNGFGKEKDQNESGKRNGMWHVKGRREDRTVLQAVVSAAHRHSWLQSPEDSHALAHLSENPKKNTAGSVAAAVEFYTHVTGSAEPSNPTSSVLPCSFDPSNPHYLCENQLGSHVP